jgi:hypothetical protein
MSADSFASQSENISVTKVIAEFCDTDFPKRIANLKHRRSWRSGGYRSGKDPDLCLVLVNSIELKSHQIVLDMFSGLFEDLFLEAGEVESGNLQFVFAFPFPEVLIPLIDLFYLMTASDFQLDAFFADRSIGNPFWYILLLSILCYLDAPTLIPRVQASLCDRWPISSLPNGLGPIQSFFVNEIEPPLRRYRDYRCLRLAFSRMKRMMSELFSLWDTRPSIPRFVNRFARIFRRPVVRSDPGGQQAWGRGQNSANLANYGSGRLPPQSQSENQISWMS